MNIVELAIEHVVVRSVLNVFRSSVISPRAKVEPEVRVRPRAVFDASVPDQITKLRMMERYQGTRSIDDPDQALFEMVPLEETEFDSLLVTIMGARK